MHDTLKYVWLILTIFTVCGVIALLPYDKWQKAYLKEYHRIKNEPQKRINTTYKYIDEVENGTINIDNGLDFETYLKKITNEEKEKTSFKRIVKPYQKPLYVRDKYKPWLLHPYRGK